MVKENVKAKTRKTKKHAFKQCQRHGGFLTILFFGVCTMNANAMDIAMPTKSKINVEDFLTSARVMANIVKDQTENPTLTVFISTSLPRPSLLAWSEEAKRYGATLVLRGFVRNSLQETIRALTLNDKSVLTVSIDPMAFEKHHVTAVPLVLFTDQDKEDRIAGNSGLQAALESIANQGDLHEEAKALLVEEARHRSLTQPNLKTLLTHEQQNVLFMQPKREEGHQ